MFLTCTSDGNPAMAPICRPLRLRAPLRRAEAVAQHTPLKALDPYPVRAHSGDVEGYCAVACLGLADGREAGGITGAWLVWYDPAGNDGNGDAAWSHDPADAARFTEREWAELYAAAPVNRPRRPDGKPNRPITMLNLMIVPVRPGELPSIHPAPEAAPRRRPTLSSRPGWTRSSPRPRPARPPRSHSPSPAAAAAAPEREPDLDKPDLSRPGALTESLRAMGLM